MPSWGFGPETERKQEDYEYIQRVHLRVVSQVQQKHDWAHPGYHLLDFTAGPGMMNGVKGGPLRFVEMARELHPDWRAWFYEQDAESAACLDAHLARYGSEPFERVRVLAADHNEAVPVAEDYLRNLKGAAMGLIYVDTNGTVLPDETVATLARLTKTLRRMDILIYVAATTYKRCRGAFGDSRPGLLDHLAAIGKPHWFVREPHHRHQWSFIFGTRYELYPEMKNIRLYSTASEKGASILGRLTRTVSELGEDGSDEGQMELQW